MTFGEPADSGVAGHLTDGVQVDRQEQGLASHAGRGQGGLDAGMTGTHHDHVIALGIHEHDEEGIQRAEIINPSGSSDSRIDQSTYVTITTNVDH